MPKAILSTGLQAVTLNAPITKDYKASAQAIKSPNASRDSYKNYADTDGDGLYDFEEIYYDYNATPLITFDENSAYLPSYGYNIPIKQDTDLQKNMTLV